MGNRPCVEGITVVFAWCGVWALSVCRWFSVCSEIVFSSGSGWFGRFVSVVFVSNFLFGFCSWFVDVITVAGLAGLAWLTCLAGLC